MGKPFKHVALPGLPPNLVTGTTITFAPNLEFSESNELKRGQEVIQLGPQEAALYSLLQKEADGGELDVDQVCKDYGLRKVLVNTFLNDFNRRGYISVSRREENKVGK